jgi:predicted RNA-binding protein with PUA-like domain
MAYWIFKCDPKKYSLARRVAEEATEEITWLVTRYRNEIAPGDTAFLMETGPHRSIRGVMRIDASPSEMSELPHEQAYWKDRDTEARCRVHGVLTHRPNLPIEKLRGVSGLEGLSIFHGFQQGTNFRVTDDEARIILAMV